MKTRNLPPRAGDSQSHDLDPVGSLALFHAAIAGVYLFLSGLIAGYYDNKAIYRQIPQRLAAVPWLNRLLGEARTRRFAHYVEHNLGGLAGNFYFGLFRGVTGTIGDPRNRARVVETLRAAGAHVQLTNAAACKLAGLLVAEMARKPR